MKDIIYVVYCYYRPFHKLPNRKWVRFKSKAEAKAFVEKKVANRNDRFLWCYVVNNVEVESL